MTRHHVGAKCCWRRPVIGAVLALAAASPARAALMEPPSGEHHTGKVIFVEMVTPDLAQAESFYGKLFGWSFHPTQSGATEYVEALLDGQAVAGLIHKAQPPNPQQRPGWLADFSVRDVDATTRLAVANGAHVRNPPHDIADFGREAVLADPQGALFGLLASSSGDPPDTRAQPGAWIWSALLTSDPDADAAFYQTLFDYEVFDVSIDAQGQHFELAADSYARASANSLPSLRPGAVPHWLNFVSVENVALAADRAVALGGHVLLPPRLDPHGGRVAVLSDPSGAVFGLMHWPDSDDPAVPK